LRSKTTKKRLTNCRAHEVRGAGAPCMIDFDSFLIILNAIR
jgi:hypothetical protein